MRIPKKIPKDRGYGIIITEWPITCHIICSILPLQLAHYCGWQRLGVEREIGVTECWEGKGREGKGREGKGRKGKERKGKKIKV